MLSVCELQDKGKRPYTEISTLLSEYLVIQVQEGIKSNVQIVLHALTVLSVNVVRVRATDRHCRIMRRNDKFGAKKLIWRQLLAKEKSQENFFVWRRNRHVFASCRIMVINVYLKCQLTPQLLTKQFSSWSSQTWTRADNLGPSINVYWVRVITYGDRHTLLTAATGNGHNYRI